MTPSEARQSFPGLEGKVYLDAAAVSLVPRQAHDAVRAFLDLAMLCPSANASQHHVAMDTAGMAAVAEAAALLRTTPDHIALVESTSHGLNVAANAIPLRSGDNVLVADTEYLQVAIPWAKKRETFGVEIRPVRSHDEGVLSVDDFARVIDPRTKVVCVSSVQWCTGYRVDVRALSALCRERNIWLVVDAIQEMGAFEIDLSQSWADFVVAGGHKWLNAPLGCGVMYVGDRALGELDPVSWGYLALEEPQGGWPAYFETPSITPYREYQFPKTAKRFENGGTFNYPGAIALDASLRLVNAIGIRQAEAHIRHLGELLYDELLRAGAHVVSKRDPAVRSGITIFSCYGDPARDRALLETLLADRIFLAMRYTSNVGGIRVSTHYYNNEDDVLRLVAALRRAVTA